LFLRRHRQFVVLGRWLSGLLVLLLAMWGGFVPRIMTSLSAAVAQGPRLTLEEIVERLSRSEPEEVIIARIREAKRPFNDISEGERAQLIRSGATELILRYLANPELPPPTPKPSTAAVVLNATPPKEVYTADPYASIVPLGDGPYLLSKSSLTPTPIELRSLLSDQKGGLFGISLPFVGKEQLGVLPGRAARLRIEATPAVFYLRLPEPFRIEDVTLIALTAESRQRSLGFLEPKEKGGKPSPKPTAVRQFDRIPVGPRLYKLSTSTLESGEFIFYLVGSADPEKNIQGKGWDFGVN